MTSSQFPTHLVGLSLQASAENGHLELVNMLLGLRADVDFPQSSHSAFAGRTALHCASMNCWAECCRLLLEHQACVVAPPTCYSLSSQRKA